MSGQSYCYPNYWDQGSTNYWGWGGQTPTYKPDPIYYNNQSCRNCPDNPANILTTILPAPINFERPPITSSEYFWTGCVEVNLLPIGVQVIYLPQQDLLAVDRYISDSTTRRLVTKFQIDNPVSNTAYGCDFGPLDQPSLELDLTKLYFTNSDSDISGSSIINPKVVTLDLPKDQVLSEKVINFTEPLTQNCNSFPQFKIVINYYYTCYCQNMTLTIKNIDFLLIGQLDYPSHHKDEDDDGDGN